MHAAGLPAGSMLLSLGPGAGTHLDLPAVGLVLACTVVVAWGVRQSTAANNVITAVVLLTIVLVMIAGVSGHAVALHNCNAAQADPCASLGPSQSVCDAMRLG